MKSTMMLVCGIAMLFQPTVASGNVMLLKHEGDANPITEGWAYSDDLVFKAESISDDMGFDAWSVKGLGVYKRTPTVGQMAQARTTGWKLSARLRVTEALAWGGVALSYGDGTNRWVLDFVLDDQDDPVVTAVTDPYHWNIGHEYAVEGAGYHLYEVIYDAVSETADVLVDGVPRITGWLGDGYTLTKTCGWSAGRRAYIGEANWNLVSLEITVPGDLSGDGWVGQTDLGIVLDWWGQAVTAGSQADPTGDGFVGQFDLDVVLANWGEGTPPTAPVPEPATLTLLALGGLVVVRRLR